MGSYAPASFWDGLFRHRRATGRDLNPEGFWATQWLQLLDLPAGQAALDLGCGTGGDALALARHSVQVVGLDYSHEAIAQAREKSSALGVPATFVCADMAAPLPFADRRFDVVMSNVAIHCLPAVDLRATLQEIARVLVPGGRFLFHVNSLEDMRFRPKVRVHELEPGYFLESDGQTIHFFSEDSVRELLRDWTVLDLAHIHFPPRAGWTDKCVWRGVAAPPDEDRRTAPPC
jgi:SAM-dependent methyltransferase